MRNSLKITIFVLSTLFVAVFFAGCSEGVGTASDDKSEILTALQRDYPPDKKSEGETSNYELFKFETIKDLPKGKEKAWCVNFLFTNKVDANSKPARWIGFGNVVKKDGKYSYEASTGCKLSDEERKKIYEMKNSG